MTNYVVCYGKKNNSKISKFSLNDNKAKKLLNGIDIEAELFASSLYFDVENLFNKKSVVNVHDKIHDSIGLFSNFLPYISIYLYNDERLLKDYPNGIVTENKILLPSSIYKEMLDEENKYNKENNQHINMASAMIVSYIGEILKNKFNIVDIVGILAKELGNLYDCYSEQSLDILKSFSPKPTLLTNKSFSKKLKDEQFSSSTIEFFEHSENSTDYIDYVLSKNNPYPQTFIPKMLNIEEQDTSLYNFKEMYSSGQLLQSFSILEQKRHNIISNNASLVEALPELENYYYECLLSLEDNHFIFEMNNFFNDITQKYGTLLMANNILKLDTNSIQLLAHSVVGHTDCTAYKRKILIDICTSSVFNRYDHEHQIVVGTEEEYQVYEQYLEACKQGDIECVKKLNQNDFTQFYFTDIKAGIFSSNNVELIAYFINNKSLKSYIEFNDDTFRYIKNSSSEVLSFIVNSVDKNTIFQNYEQFLGLAVKKDNTTLTEYFLTSQDSKDYFNSIDNVEKSSEKIISYAYNALIHTSDMDKGICKNTLKTLMEFLKNDIKQHKHIVGTINFEDRNNEQYFEKAGKIKDLANLYSVIHSAARSKSVDILEFALIENNIPISDSWAKIYKEVEPEDFEIINRFYQLQLLNNRLELNLNNGTENKKVKM